MWFKRTHSSIWKKALQWPKPQGGTIPEQKRVPGAVLDTAPALQVLVSIAIKSITLTSEGTTAAFPNVLQALLQLQDEKEPLTRTKGSVFSMERKRPKMPLLKSWKCTVFCYMQHKIITTGEKKPDTFCNRRHTTLSILREGCLWSFKTKLENDFAVPQSKQS